MRTLKEYEEASEEIRQAAENLCGGDATEDDMEIARVISNMAVDVAEGDKAEAKFYLDKIAARHPAILRLISRVGLTMAKAAGSTKQ